jgi:hypothetical protein
MPAKQGVRSSEANSARLEKLLSLGMDGNRQESVVGLMREREVLTPCCAMMLVEIRINGTNDNALG